MIQWAAAKLPDDFNTALSTLFGGHYEDLYAGPDSWAGETRSGLIDESVGMRKEKARVVANIGKRIPKYTHHKEGKY